MNDFLTKPLFQRSLPLFKSEGIKKIAQAKVAIFGLGGVGSYTAEALARSGIGYFELVDKDYIEPSNINRQLCALETTIGQAKVDVVENRILQINSQAKIVRHQLSYSPENDLAFLADDLDYIVDAIDTVKAKSDLIIKAKKKNIPIVSALGAGNKYDPTKFQVCDIFDTYNDPLAKAIRSQLKKAGVTNHKVVFSPEKPAFKNPSIISSLAYVPSVSGLICAYVVIQDIVGLP